jgi:hypothetical protein
MASSPPTSFVKTVVNFGDVPQDDTTAFALGPTAAVSTTPRISNTSFYENTSFLSRIRNNINDKENYTTLAMIFLGGFLFYFVTAAILLALDKGAKLGWYALIVFGTMFALMLGFVFFNASDPRYPKYQQIIDYYKKNLVYIKNIKMLVLYGIYTLFILILFTAKDTKNEQSAFFNTQKTLVSYGYIIYPILFIIGAILAYSTAMYQKIHDEDYRKQYYALMYVFTAICIITFYYTNEKNGNSYMQTALGTAFKITVIISILFLVYNVLMYSILYLTPNTTFEKVTVTDDFYKSTKWLLLLFVIFMAFIIVAIYAASHSDANNPYMNGQKTDASDPEDFIRGQTFKFIGLMIGAVTIMVVLFWLLWSKNVNNHVKVSETSNFLESKFAYLIKIICVFIFFVLLIYWAIASLIALRTKRLGWFEFIINFAILGLFVWLIVKYYFKISEDSRRPKFIKFILNIIYFIPCLVTDSYLVIKQAYDEKFVRLLLVLILIITAFVKIQSFKQLLVNQNGRLIVESPISLDKSHVVTIADLWPYKSIANEFSYNYALSFWVNIDAFDKISTSQECISVINYFNFPNICYRHSPTDSETKRIIAPQLSFQFQPQNDNNKYTLNVPLDIQKWNHIVINYSNNILDVFCNNNLINTLQVVMPSQKGGSGIFTIGSDQGIQGAVCNMNFYENPLSLYQISYLYNLVYLLNPPILLNTGDSIKNVIRPSDE